MRLSKSCQGSYISIWSQSADKIWIFSKLSCKEINNCFQILVTHTELLYWCKVGFSSNLLGIFSMQYMQNNFLWNKWIQPMQNEIQPYEIRVNWTSGNLEKLKIPFWVEGDLWCPLGWVGLGLWFFNFSFELYFWPWVLRVMVTLLWFFL